MPEATKAPNSQPEKGAIGFGALDGALYGVAEAEDSFKAVRLLPRYTPDKQPFEKFYVPLLSRAVEYQRAVGYWSAAELMYAAQGVAQFIARGGRMQLIVGAQLHKGDVDAVLSGAPLDDVVAARLLADPDLAGAKIVKNQHLAVLAWMVKTGQLEIRVGVPMLGDRLLSYAESGRYFHTKYGVFTDSYGNKVAFTGSNNATIPGWSKNHETFDVQPSWLDTIWAWNGVATVSDFDRHWNERPDEGWAIIPLPLAVKEHLLSNAPDAPPRPPVEPVDDEPVEDEDLAAAWAELVALAEAPAARDYTAVGTAAVEPLPHQARLVHRVVESYPRGYVFADEVGLGKTIEVGLVLREMLLSRRVKRALVLVPASVLGQWQEELHDKMSLDVPRYTGTSFEDRHGQVIDLPAGTNPWSAFPIVLASSHLARRKSRRQQLLDAGPWDVVVVDEAHHARRRGSKPTSTPNSLLALLLEMRDRDMWRALYLASATPMQMNAHEAWDLIALLGLSGRWAQSAKDFLGYFERLRTDPSERDWTTLSRMLGDYFSDPKAERDKDLEKKIMDDLGWVSSFTILGLDQTPIPRETAQSLSPAAARWADAWLRRHTPMRDRVFRNTRQTMRLYQQAGIIREDVIIPYRHVNDAFIPLADNERRLYERIEEYIRRHYNTYKADKATQALGFIMTVYRRRLTSSFDAIRCSLRRRLDVLEQGKSLGEMLSEDDGLDVETSLFDPEDFDATADLLSDEIGELRSFIAELDKITGEDTKATRLINDIRDSLNTYSSVVVFTQYTDTLDYVRERLVTADYRSIGCYSGRGGEVYEPATKTWEPITKADLKVRFRNGNLTILLGTDSMSEGLNLQTCGRLINYDMPWNLMRVEQRIGRIDRIGAAYRNLRVTNYFYADTVEQRVYEGIAEDYTDFTDIVGNAQPVLGNIEKTIEQLALTDAANRDAEADKAVAGIRTDIAALADQPVRADDLGDAPVNPEEVQRPPVLVGAVSLETLQARLTSNALTQALLVPVPDCPAQFRLLSITTGRPDVSFDYAASPTRAEDVRAGGGPGVLVTFDRAVAEAAGAEGPTLLTYGTSILSSLLPAPTSET